MTALELVPEIYDKGISMKNLLMKMHLGLTLGRFAGGAPARGVPSRFSVDLLLAGSDSSLTGRTLRSAYFRQF